LSVQDDYGEGFGGKFYTLIGDVVGEARSAGQARKFPAKGQACEGSDIWVCLALNNSAVVIPWYRGQIGPAGQLNDMVNITLTIVTAMAID